MFAVRVIAIVALALLGATPLVRCSRLAIGRNAGGSVALVIVVDDSLSMRALSDGTTKFERAKKGAADLVRGAREGDVVALILAGEPARVALAPTPDLSLAADAIDRLQPSDRATDLDAALDLAQSSIRDLPYKDRRVVLLSDLCDGRPDAQPLGSHFDVPLWAPRQGFDGAASDCAVVRAERRESQVTARVACSGPASKQRVLQVRSGDRVLTETSIEPYIRQDLAAGDITLEVPEQSPAPSHVQLAGPDDSIASDDRAPIAQHTDKLVLGVVSDRARSGIVTGGPPPIEQALVALDGAANVRPLVSVPDSFEALAPLTALILDDPPGLTPESRDVITRWLERGGVGFAALGARSAGASLGTSFEPFVRGVPRWDSPAPSSVDAATAALLGPSAESLDELRPQGRALLDPTLEGTTVLVRWQDGQPWLTRRQLQRGVAFTLALPMSASSSDLVVRPAFLALLSHVLDTARSQSGARRVEVGRSWVFEHVAQVEAQGPSGVVAVDRLNGAKRITPTVAGLYNLRLDGEVQARFASIPEREIDLRPRPIVPNATSQALGDTSSSVDISRYIAIGLLALLAAELVWRAIARAFRPGGQRPSMSG